MVITNSKKKKIWCLQSSKPLACAFKARLEILWPSRWAELLKSNGEFSRQHAMYKPCNAKKYTRVVHSDWRALQELCYSKKMNYKDTVLGEDDFSGKCWEWWWWLSKETHLARPVCYGSVCQEQHILNHLCDKALISTLLFPCCVIP